MLPSPLGRIGATAVRVRRLTASSSLAPATLVRPICTTTRPAHTRNTSVHTPPRPQPFASPICLQTRRFHATPLASSPAATPDAGAPALPQLLHTIRDVRAAHDAIHRAGGSIGFVPTMGALHAGHVALAARSMAENSHTFVSIFVNPTQFAAHEDLSTYPRTLEADLQALRAIGVQYVFAPSVKEMYPAWPTFLTSVHMAGTETTAEGKQRPGHFSGVATVVTKLLNIVQPHRAYFGQKDGMQCVVVRRVVRDLDLPVDVRICPTTRAADGLALSSRNVYLTPQERAVAPVLFRALTAANDLYLSGEREATKLKRAASAILSAQPEGRLEYVSLAAADSGAEVPDDARVDDVVLDSQGEVVSGGAMLSVAYKLGKPRLIDNCILGVKLEKGRA